MRHLNGVYTQRFNRRHRRVGHVFQGRYKGIFVDADEYLTELARYVVLNPVRAGMVKSAGQWKWSSYRMTIGKQVTPSWFVKEQVLCQFSRELDIAQKAYIDFVAQGLNQPRIWDNLRHQIYLGDKHFVSRMQGLIDNPSSLLEVPIAQRCEMAKPLSYYASEAGSRDEAIRLAFQTGHYTMKAIADYFLVHYSTVSRVINK